MPRCTSSESNQSPFAGGLFVPSWHFRSTDLELDKPLGFFAHLSTEEIPYDSTRLTQKRGSLQAILVSDNDQFPYDVGSLALDFRIKSAQSLQTISRRVHVFALRRSFVLEEPLHLRRLATPPVLLNVRIQGHVRLPPELSHGPQVIVIGCLNLV